MVAGDTELVIPGPKVAGTGSENFIIPTFATQANCSLLDDLCEKDTEGGRVNCTSAGYPGFPYYSEDKSSVSSTGGLSNRVSEVAWLETASSEILPITSNPVKMAIQLQWQPLVNGLGAVGSAKPKRRAIAMRQDVGLGVDQSSRPTLYASCDVTFLNAFAQWNSTTQDWTVVNSTQSSDQLATTLSLATAMQYATEQLAVNLKYTAQRRSKEVVMEALGPNLAELTLVAAAGYYRPAKASNVTETEKLLVSVYPVLPIMTLLALLCIYALLASAIFLSAYRTPDEAIIIPGVHHALKMEEIESSTLTLAQRWLTNPMPLVGFSFPTADGLDGMRSASYFAVNSAQDGDDARTRLAIGLNGQRFGVISWGERRCYVEEA
ncbi:hypothetical protein FRC00_005664 [Tulasnella sp. 408]|nr:hypothetical protein FRC00_005664 [Tulasnella sp. 408]